MAPEVAEQRVLETLREKPLRPTAVVKRLASAAGEGGQDLTEDEIRAALRQLSNERRIELNLAWEFEVACDQR
jgi:hypothetical protein